jgi:hypothetical protein
MVAAIIAQAAVDYVECRVQGLIDSNNVINKQKVMKLSENLDKLRNPMPKWMDITDVYSCVSFLFKDSTLEDYLPSCWETSSEAIRRAVKKAGDEGRQINHFFSIDRDGRDEEK